MTQQYQPQSLEDHLANGRPWDLDRTEGGLLILHPFTGPEGGFSHGNADALWRHRRLIAEFDADVVLVVNAGGVYSLDYGNVVDAHLALDADITVATTRVEDARRFGVVMVDEGGRVRAFSYKPEQPTSDPGRHRGLRLPALGSSPRPRGAGGRTRDPLGLRGRARAPPVAGGRAFECRFDGYWRDVGPSTATGRPIKTCSRKAAVTSISSAPRGPSAPPVPTARPPASRRGPPSRPPCCRRDP